MIGSKNDAKGKIVIFGQYKTGTTAFFYKIRNSIPSNTRTLFEAQEYVPEKEDAYRWILAKVILGIPDGSAPIKYDTFMGFGKKIYIVRDPRDWLISGILFSVQQIPSLYEDAKLAQIMRLLKQKEKDPRSQSVIRLLEQILQAVPDQSLESMRKWLSRHHQWLFDFEDQLHDYYIVKYEDFVDGNIKALEHYLDIPLRDEVVIDEVHDHVIRTKNYGNWKNWFLEEDISFFKPLFEEYIYRYGYSNEWCLNHRQTILPEHCTEYIDRTVRKRKKTSNCQTRT